MNVTHGKVYLQEREIDPDGKEFITEKLLDSVTFRNLDHALYSPDRTISPLFEKYKGRPYCVQFKINQEDKNGNPVEFTARLKMGYDLGLVPPQDLESVPTAHENVTKWMESVGILSGDPATDYGYKVMEEVQGSSMVYSLAPGCKIKDMWSLQLHVDPMMVMDEYVDNGARCKATSFKTTRLYWSSLTDIIKGKRSADDVEKFLRQLNLPPPYFKFFQVAKELRRLLLLKSPELGQPVIKTFQEFYDGAILEGCAEWKQKEKDPNSVMYKKLEHDLRVFTRSGCPYAVELILFDRNCLLPEELRESFLFKSIVSSFSAHLSLVNDILSIKKELKEGITSNKVFLYHVHDGLSLEDAFKKIVDEINMYNDMTLEIGDFILDIYGDLPEAVELVTVMKGVLFGGIQWHGITTRYHPELVLDCVIGPEPNITKK